MTDLVCWNCGLSLRDAILPITRHSHCPDCFNALHCCLMCIHYDTRRPGSCDHERAEPPIKKETGNFCEYFSSKPGAWRQASGSRGNEARDRLAALFDEKGQDDQAGNASEENPGDEARSRLDDLFKD